LRQGTFVGRQPIVDREECVVGYELLYRASATAAFAEIEDVGQAVLRVIVNTFASLGMDAVLGEGDGFFNVNRDVLLSDAIEALPRERVVIELLEGVDVDETIIRRFESLHEAGFRLALDDWVVDDPRAALLPWADVVKVDLPAIPPKALRRVARELRRAEVVLLAEKVETREEFEACRAMGFDRFQGYFFARPIVLEGVDLDPGRAALIQLIQQIGGQAETSVIAESFKQDADLGLNLLRLVNTAGQATRVRLESIESAIQHLGLQQLGRWITILLYAQGHADAARSPLLATAAHRGRLMELIVGHAAGGSNVGSERERAFLVGMLSLADALLGRHIDDLVGELRLCDEVGRALTHREGVLGGLLAFAEAIEGYQLDKLEPELEHYQLDFESLQILDNDSHAWVHGMLRSGLRSSAG